MSIGIIILHYGDWTTTLRLLDSFRWKTDWMRPLCIISNSGPIGTDFIQDGLGPVDVIVNRHNMGFARGMNTGIASLRDTYGCCHILCMNNDLVVQDPFMISKMIVNWKRDRTIACIGPRIVSPDGVEQNPSMFQLPGRAYFVLRVLKNMFAFSFPLVYRRFGHWARRYASMRLLRGMQSTKSESFLDGPVLHGACFMLTQSYFAHYRGLYPYTYLFAEEYFLKLLIQRVGMKSTMTNETWIFHDEHNATEARYKTDRSTLRFRFGQELRSLLRYLAETR